MIVRVEGVKELKEKVILWIYKVTQYEQVLKMIDEA